MPEPITINVKKNGQFKSPGDKEKLAKLAKSGISDLVMFCHGWKNTADDAERNFGKLWDVAAGKLEGKASQFGVVMLVWPAKQFRTEFDNPNLTDGSDGGALSADGSPGTPDDVSDELLEHLVDDLVASIDGKANKEAIQKLKKSALAMSEDWTDADLAAFFDAFRGLMNIGPANADDIRDDLNMTMLIDPSEDPVRLLEVFMDPVGTQSFQEGEAAGFGGFLRGAFDSTRGSIGRILNQGTYFYMKKRAGIVGEALSAHLGTLSAPGLERVHLVGHSFGGRLVSACANIADKTGLKNKLRSLSILQGAFSHNALAAQTPFGVAGGFRNILGSSAVTGPIVVTHTHNDKAVTVAYALASRLSNENASSVGGPDSQFGGIGANGALHLQANQIGPTKVLRQSGRINLTPGQVHNLNADTVIMDHNDVYGVRIGELLAREFVS